MMPVKTATGLSWRTAPSADLDTRVGTLESGLAQAQTDL